MVLSRLRLLLLLVLLPFVVGSAPFFHWSGAFTRPGCGATCFRVVQVVGRTTTGTEDYTVTDFGTPTAYLTTISYGQTNGSTESSWGFGVGAGDLTNAWAASTYDENSQNPADVGRTASAVASLRLVDVAGGISGNALFSATIPDGVRLDYPSNPLNNAHLINGLLIKAANVTAGTGTHTGAQDASQTFTVGHTVDVVFFVAVGQAFNATQAAFNKMSVGVAVNGSGQWSISHVSDDAVSPTFGATRVQNNRVVINMSAGTGAIFEAGEITSYPANAFAMTKRDTANDVRFAYLAIELHSGFSAWAAVHDTPTSTGQQVVTTPSFPPQFLFGATSYVDTVNTVRTTNATGAGSLGVVMADATNLYAHHVATEDAQVTSDAQSLSTTGEILVADGAGAQVFDVDALAFTATGFNWTFNTSVPGTARKWGLLAISQ